MVSGGASRLARCPASRLNVYMSARLLCHGTAAASNHTRIQQDDWVSRCSQNRGTQHSRAAAHAAQSTQGLI